MKNSDTHQSSDQPPDSDFEPVDESQPPNKIVTGDPELDRLLALVTPPRSVPFFWQHGNRLLMLTEESGFWTFADLWFDQSSITYEERKLIVYEWEREAIGAFLSRALAAGPESVESAAQAMNRWLVTHFGHTIDESRAGTQIRS